MTGMVFDIKKFAIHDGPGIRSTLFLKGCPLRCVWCHNPEGINHKRELWFSHNQCIRCRSCLEVCPETALTTSESSEPFISIDRSSCSDCGRCVEVCPSMALSFDSSFMTVPEAVDKLLQDQPFYGESGGGVTISGGDPLFQHKFSREVLKRCKSAGIHTAVETSMQARPEILDSLIEFVDLFIVDLKLMDADAHRKYIGTDNADNGLILSNFVMLAEKGVELLIRIPLIPGITATEDNIRNIAQYVKSVSSAVSIELINFNPLAESKYRQMGKEYAYLSELKPFGQEDLDRFYGILTDIGVSYVR